MLGRSADRLAAVAAAAMAMTLAGCQDSPFDFAPVVGVVTLDGEPLPEARVTFMPRAKGDSLRAGPDSMCKTDSQGRFELNTIDGKPGAVVGEHRVRISTFLEMPVGGPDNFEVVSEERVPAKYNIRSTLTCEVPADGLSDYRFDLVTK